MIQIDSGVIITALIAIISLAAWVGSLAQKVKGHGKAIENNRTASVHALERLHTENREDHQMIFNKLEQIRSEIRNGHGG